MRKYLYIVIMATTMCSCGTSTGLGGVQQSSTQLEEQDYAVARKVNEASLKLFHEVYKMEKRSDNFCISPASASWALSMAATGARSATAAELYSAMGFDTPDADAIGNYQQKVIARLAMHGDRQTTIAIANSMWINKGFKAKKAFVRENEKFYNAAVMNCAFDADAVKAINTWCSENTSGRISEIVKEISPTAQMYLINALYFNSRWKSVFSEKRTKEELFTKESGEKIKVQMMHGGSKARYFENEMVQMTEKPFDKGAFCMYFILPREGVSMDEAATALSANFYAWCDSTVRCDVNLSLPRYSAEYSTSLKDALQALGVKEAFTSAADFSGISDEGLRIGNVLQKSFIKVNEEGAEAAAVTSVMLEATAAGPPVIKNMKLDRPFFYAICETATGGILFMGKSGHPKE